MMPDKERFIGSPKVSGTKEPGKPPKLVLHFPKALVEAIDLEPGERLHVYLKDSEVILRRPE